MAVRRFLQVVLNKVTQGSWEQMRDYVREDLENLELLLNQGVKLLDPNDPTESFTTITVDNVIVTPTGGVTVQDENLNKSTFTRNLAEGTRIDIESIPSGIDPYFTIRLLTDPSPLASPDPVVRIGVIGSGATGSGQGLRAFALTAGQVDWDMRSGALSAGPAWILADVTNGERVLAAVLTGGVYQFRPETTVPDVWLGAPSSGKRFAQGHIIALTSTTLTTTDLFERGRTESAGDWKDVPYNAGHFTADGGASWGVDSGDVLVYAFALEGQTMHLQINIANTDVSTASPIQLMVAMPAGYTVTKGFVTPFIYDDAGSGFTTGVATANAGDAVIRFQQLSFVPWSITAGDDTDVYLSATFQVTG